MSELWGLDRDRVLDLTPADFAVSRRLDTRWRDNDAFGHVNNAVYYEYFDTALNTWLLEALPDNTHAAAQRFVVESGCRYLRPFSYPTPLLVTHRVARLGSTSVTYEWGSSQSLPATSSPSGRSRHWVGGPTCLSTRPPVARCACPVRCGRYCTPPPRLESYAAGRRGL